jgi:type IV pilus assembly protein PilE
MRKMTEPMSLKRLSRSSHGCDPAGRQAGFTLVELLIVTAVIAILAAIAYPSYTAQMLKSQRAEGKASLMRAAQQLERSFTQEGSYPAGTGALATLYGGAAGTAVYSDPDNPFSATSGKFLIQYIPAAGAAPVDYELRATPQANAIADAECPTLGMDSRGRRLVSGVVPPVTDRCWR